MTLLQVLSQITVNKKAASHGILEFAQWTRCSQILVVPIADSHVYHAGKCIMLNIIIHHDLGQKTKFAAQIAYNMFLTRL